MGCRISIRGCCTAPFGARCLADGLLDDEAASVTAARMLDVSTLDADSLRGAEAGHAASVVAARPGVRAALLDLQRAFRGPAGWRRIGRAGYRHGDLPRCAPKLFVTATAEERALRRYRELKARGSDLSLEAVLATSASGRARFRPLDRSRFSRRRMQSFWTPPILASRRRWKRRFTLCAAVWIPGEGALTVDKGRPV